MSDTFNSNPNQRHILGTGAGDGYADLRDIIAAKDRELAHLQKALNERELELIAVKARLAVLEPFAEVMDDEFMRRVAGYGYNVLRIHEAWMRVRAAIDTALAATEGKP